MNNVKKSIGWAAWTLNPVKGLCPMPCEYCYAKRFYQRGCNATFKDKTIRYDPSVFIDLYKAKPGDRIFVGSTIELFHPRTNMWNDEIINYCARTKDMTFIFLTKCPQNLPKEWPDNCWVGVSVTDELQLAHYNLTTNLADVKANVKFISFEPIHGKILEPYLLDLLLKLNGISWVIIGAQTPYSPKTAPKIEWISEIEASCKNASIPYFEKDNLKPLLNRDLIQQFPMAKGGRK
jgi:protein gp37